MVGTAALLVQVVAGVAAVGSASDLIDAVKADDIQVVRALLGRGASADVSTADGTTALALAVDADNDRMVDLLIRGGARVDIPNRYGVTPLYLAASNANAAIAKRLIAAGANVNETRPEGETPLMAAARTGNADVVTLLLAHSALVNARERWLGETALMLAAAEDRAPVVRILLDHGADPDIRALTLDGEPRRDRSAVALEPLRFNMTFPRGGMTALMLAARQGSRESAKNLVAAGADLNIIDPEGIGALVLALINGHYDVAKVLIEAGADVNATEPDGRTPLWAAVDMHTIEYTLNRPPPPSYDAVDGVEVVTALLQRGADPNAVLKQTVRMRKINAGNPPLLGTGATALMRAATHADLAVLRVLVAGGADPNRKTRIGTTALMLAAGLGWRDLYSGGSEDDAIEFVKVCLSDGGDINAANDDGNTALHGAAQRGSAKVIRFLVANGARPVVNKQGLTPLDEAERFVPVRAEAARVLRELTQTSR